MAAKSFPEMTWWRLSIYALPGVPMAFWYVPLTALLPAFYAEHVGVGLAAMGGFLLISRLFDIFIDPVLGRWCDNTKTRFGRRRPWIVLGAPICMLGVWLLLMPPEGANGWYLLMATMTINLGGSILGLAYSAWGAEIVETYHGRAKVAAFREGSNIIGIVLASLVPAITAAMGHGIDRFTMSVMCWALMIMIPITVAAAVYFVPEPDRTPQTSMPWFSAMLTLLKNKPFALLCGSYFLTNFGVAVTNLTLIFFIQHYLGQPEVIGPVMLASFGSVLLGVPAWVLISRRIGKHRAAGISLIIAVCLSGVLALQLRPGDGWLFVALMAGLGAISAAFLTLPLGIVGDIIDYDTLRTGQSRGGLFFGVWSFLGGGSIALALGVTLPALEAFGFSASGGNTPAALEALRYIYCLGSVPFFLIGAAMFFVFPIDARRHAIIRRRLDKRRAAVLDVAPHAPQTHELSSLSTPRPEQTT